VLGLPAIALSPARAAGVILLEPEGRLLCSGAPGPRLIRAILPDGDGGQYLVTDDLRGWFDFSPAEGWDVFLIHLDRGLGPLPVGDGVYAADPCGAILLGGNADQRAGQALPWEPGTLLVAGSDARDGPPRVFVQEFDAEGRGLLGSAPVVVSNPAIDSRFPVTAPDSQGGVLIAWTEVGNPFESRILLRRLDGGGTAVWDRPVVVSAGGSAFRTADLVPDGEGGAYIAWHEWRADEPGGGSHLRVQRVGHDGQVRWSPGGLRPLEGDDGPEARLVGDGPGGVIVVSAGGAMRAQKISASGNRLWGDAGLALSDPSTAGDAISPDVSIAPDGSVYVTWLARGAVGNHRIFARRLERMGGLPWPTPVPVLAHRHGAGWRSQALLADGSLGIVWEDFREDGEIGTSDLYAQAIDRRGRTKAPPDGTPVIVAGGRQSVPMMSTPRPSGPLTGTAAGTDPPEAIIAWSDTRWTSLRGGSESIVLQTVRFSSAPRFEPIAATSLRQASTATLSLRGDDLHAGLTVDAGAGVVVEEAVVIADSEGGPGDTLHLRVRVDPAAPPGPRDLTVANPDGGSTVLASFLRIDLDPRRIDVDHSGRVDGFDLAILARSFGQMAGERLYVLDADIDVSGQVDGIDLALLAFRFGIQTAALLSAPAR
jgi:hypothetical protein